MKTDKQKLANKNWYEKNKERILAELREKYANNENGAADKAKAREKKLREENPEKLVERKKKEKETNRDRYSIYWRWKNMMKRCFSPKNPDYSNYGGRGITVVAPLIIFEDYKLYVESLDKPKGFCYNREWQLDRINNDGNYEIGNLRWVTAKENLENSRNKKNNPSLKRNKGVI